MPGICPQSSFLVPSPKDLEIFCHYREKTHFFVYSQNTLISALNTLPLYSGYPVYGGCSHTKQFLGTS